MKEFKLGASLKSEGADTIAGIAKSDFIFENESVSKLKAAISNGVDSISMTSCVFSKGSFEDLKVIIAGGSFKELNLTNAKLEGGEFVLNDDTLAHFLDGAKLEVGTLSIGTSDITDNAAKIIVDAIERGDLKISDSLHVEFTSITDDGMKYLVDHGVNAIDVLGH